MENPTVPGVPASAFLALDETRDGLLHWIRLRALRNTLQEAASEQDAGAVQDIDARLSALLPEVKAHAANLASFYRTYGEAIDAVVDRAAASVEDERLRGRLQASGAGYAARAEEGAGVLAGPDDGSTQSVFNNDATAAFCDYLAAAQLESDVACISTGDPLQCSYGNLIAELSDTYC